MDDLYSGHNGVGVMRYCLIGGLVLECMKSAFASGLRSVPFSFVHSHLSRPEALLLGFSIPVMRSE